MADPIGHHRGEQIRLGRDQTVEGPGRNTRPLSHSAHAGTGIAAALELRIGRLDHQWACLLVRPQLRPAAGSADRTRILSHNGFPIFLDKAYVGSIWKTSNFFFETSRRSRRAQRGRDPRITERNMVTHEA